jgi:hypothetical protein
MTNRSSELASPETTRKAIITPGKQISAMEFPEIISWFKTGLSTSFNIFRVMTKE